MHFQGNAYTKDSLYSNCSGYKREMTRSWHDLAKGSLHILKRMDLHHNGFVDIHLPKWKSISLHFISLTHSKLFAFPLVLCSIEAQRVELVLGKMIFIIVNLYWTLV